MQKFKFIDASIPGLIVIEPHAFEDDRGFFMETYSGREFEPYGINARFVQDGHSKSKRGVLRGLHFQRNHMQAKLVRVVSGAVFDVAVDIRKDSPTFGKWHGILLSAENKLQVYLPEGFAHGFLALEDDSEVLYKTNEFYHPEDEDGIIWNDPDVGIQWPIEKVGKLTVSPKDSALRRLAEMEGL